MNHHTLTTTFGAPRDEVFAFLADIEKLPEWATEFAREVKPVDGRYKVVNGLGEFFFEALPNGGSAFTFTMFRGPGQPEEQFEGQFESLRREFDNLERRFGPARR
jgi:hypothetical protein